jgi:hypothetical protein
MPLQDRKPPLAGAGKHGLSGVRRRLQHERLRLIATSL